MVKSKTKISKQLKRKTNTSLVETIILAKKNPEWLKVADILSRPRKKKSVINLLDLDKIVKDEKGVLFPGKILSQGEFTKKTKIVALGFSDEAKRKLLNSKCEVVLIEEEINKNPKMKDLKLVELENKK
jgi:large subunit ribosomal protein L18e